MTNAHVANPFNIDMFMTWAPFVSRNREAPASGADVDGRSLAHPLPFLREQGFACEVYKCSRTPLSERAFGKLAMHHEMVRGRCLGMLCDASDFWLYESYGGNPLRLTRAKWTQPGTRDLVAAFFSAVPEPPLLSALRDLCAAFGTEVVVPTAADTPHLGCGASGHVFAVGHPDRPQALKVVLSGRHESAFAVSREFNDLKRASALGAAVSPVKGAIRHLERGGAPFASGYLMQHVGMPCTLCGPGRVTVAAVFGALERLHDAYIYHGDARLPNLLVVDGELRWIDFRSAAPERNEPLTREERADLVMEDVNALVGSCLPYRRAPQHSEALAPLLAEYPASAPRLHAYLQAIQWELV
jgi:hypothetical protein